MDNSQIATLLIAVSLITLVLTSAFYERELNRLQHQLELMADANINLLDNAFRRNTATPLRFHALSTPLHVGHVHTADQAYDHNQLVLFSD